MTLGKQDVRAASLPAVIFLSWTLTCLQFDATQRGSEI